MCRTRAVDQHIGHACFALHMLHGGLHLFGVRYICCKHAVLLSGRCAQALACSLQRIGVARHKPHARAFFREQLSQRQPHAAGSSGDERQAPLIGILRIGHVLSDLGLFRLVQA